MKLCKYEPTASLKTDTQERLPATQHVPDLIARQRNSSSERPIYIGLNKTMVRCACKQFWTGFACCFVLLVVVLVVTTLDCFSSFSFFPVLKQTEKAIKAKTNIIETHVQH